MKRSADERRTPPPAKRVRWRPPESSDEEDSCLEEMEDDQSQSLSPSQILSQDEHFAGIKSENMLSEAEVGVIDKITLINFMCHKRLDIALSPNVNFVLGRNGSGKSAIMTGIVVGLGGNARNTERGKSLKQFIKSGERSSEVRVTLRNRGKEAYHHELYGDAIIVERVISNDGAGSYKIKSSGGKTISTKKEELVNILDHCGVQVDNPVSLLNQDTSRHFLQKSKAGDKYKLFMKATHLEQIASDYEKAEQDQKIMKEAIKRQRNMLPEFKAEAKKLEEKVDTFKRLTDMEGKVDRLEEELQWALVAEIEKGIAPIEKDIEKEKARIPRNAKKMKDTEESMKKWSAEEKKVQECLSKTVEDASTLQNERDAAVNEKRILERSIRDLNSKASQLMSQIKDKEKEKKCLETTRDNCIAMSQRDIAGEKEQREQKLLELQKRLARLDGEITTAENDIKQFDADAKRAMDKQNTLRRRIDAENESYQKCERRLHQLQSGHNDRLAMFGQNMKQLVNTINRNRQRFAHTPIGPLGSKVKLRDYSWSTAVEQVLKASLLYGFVVDNHRDADVLRKMIASIYNSQGGRQQGPRPEVIVSKFQDAVYDVRRNRPRCQHPTVFDVLEVEDPNVLNALIDQASVESILLMRTREEASKVIVHERPQGAKSAYTAEGDQVLQYAHYSNRFGKLGILRESVELAVRDEEAQLAGLRRTLDELRGEEAEHRRNADGSKRHVQAAMRKVKERTLEKRKVNAAMEELQNAQEEEEPEEDIATYDSEIAELEEEIANLRGQHSKLKEEHNKVKSDRLECFQKCERFEKDVEKMSTDVSTLKNKMRDFSHKKQEAKQSIKHFQDRINIIQSSIAELEEKVANQKTRAEAAIRQAEEVCPRIETDRSRQSIRSEIEKLKRRIEQELPEKEEQERIENQYMEAMERYERTNKAISDEQDALKKLKESLDFRKSKYINLQERITMRTKVFFTHFLHQRDYDGIITFNHDKERLDIEVRVDCHTNQSKSTKNTKALSGGERSFTTVCFIMSLWEAMEAPFRCLDEFDVFMDMMNRRISMRLMLEHAEEQPNRQFIFFTPQDMSSMGIKFENRKVKVLKLNPPERGQAVLNAREN